MDIQVKEKFLELWKKYFHDTDLPIVFYYTNEEGHAELTKPSSIETCVIGALADVRKGKSLCLDADSIGCPGGKRYLGFAEEIRPDLAEEIRPYFLSCGIPGKVRGERYKKSPELVKEWVRKSPRFKAPGRFVIFKRWDKLQESDEPEVVIFFAKPDVLSGLFTLANYDQAEPNVVFTPMGSGCSSIVEYPYFERDAEKPRGVIGMFDVSARPFVPDDVLTFSTPMSKLLTMIEHMDESFLITDSWKKVLLRIGPIR